MPSTVYTSSMDFITRAILNAFAFAMSGLIDDLYDEEEIPDLVEMTGIEKKVIPVTILSGFLGSGKTTLLSHILRGNHGLKIAVIENEFSAGLGIEGMIAKSGIDGQNLDSFFELNNGCVSR